MSFLLLNSLRLYGRENCIKLEMLLVATFRTRAIVLSIGKTLQACWCSKSSYRKIMVVKPEIDPGSKGAYI